MAEDAQNTLNDFVKSLLGHRVSYASLFLNSLRICIDRKLQERTGFFLWLEPVWHLGGSNGILVGSRQAQTEDLSAHAALGLLVESILGRQINSIAVDALTHDIDVRLSEGYWVRTFVSDPTAQENWYLRDCESGLVVTAYPSGLRLENRPALDDPS
jgi:hypothetical protein